MIHNEPVSHTHVLIEHPKQHFTHSCTYVHTCISYNVVAQPTYNTQTHVEMIVHVLKHATPLSHPVFSGPAQHSNSFPKTMHQHHYSPFSVRASRDRVTTLTRPQYNTQSTEMLREDLVWARALARGPENPTPHRTL